MTAEARVVDRLETLVRGLRKQVGRVADPAVAAALRADLARLDGLRAPLQLVPYLSVLAAAVRRVRLLAEAAGHPRAARVRAWEDWTVRLRDRAASYYATTGR